MSKELTEQWRNGTLPKGWYYVEISSEEIKKLYCGDGETLELDDPETSAYYYYYKKHDESKIDILGIVPGYMDCKGLIYDSIALDKARKRIDELETKCSQLEKQIECLQEQLKESNQLILSCKRGVKSIYATSIAYGHYWAERDAKSINTLINKYLRKWGLK